MLHAVAGRGRWRPAFPRPGLPSPVLGPEAGECPERGRPLSLPGPLWPRAHRARFPLPWSRSERLGKEGASPAPPTTESPVLPTLLRAGLALRRSLNPDHLPVVKT